MSTMVASPPRAERVYLQDADAFALFRDHVKAHEVSDPVASLFLYRSKNLKAGYKFGDLATNRHMLGDFKRYSLTPLGRKELKEGQAACKPLQGAPAIGVRKLWKHNVVLEPSRQRKRDGT